MMLWRIVLYGVNLARMLQGLNLVESESRLVGATRFEFGPRLPVVATDRALPEFAPR